MIITSDNIVFLDNPKCGSSTMRDIYYSIMYKVIFQSNKTLKQCGGNYSHPSYVHCNLSAAMQYIRFVLRKNPNDYVFFTTTRNPYKRIESQLNYNIKRNSLSQEEKIKKQVPDAEEDASLDDILKHGSHLLNFAPEKFRFVEDFGVTGLINCETLYVGLRAANNKYRLGLELSKEKHANRTKKKNPIIWEQKHVDLINHYFKKDFLHGSYEYRSAEELNNA